MLNLMFFLFILTAGAVVAAPMIPVVLGYRTMAIERIDGRTYFQTKGDANDTPDPDLADARADDQTVGTCDSNGVSTSYTTNYIAAAPAGFKVVGVTVSGIANTCDGKTIEVALTGSGRALIEEQTTTVPTDAVATSVTLTFSDADSLAEAVTGVHVMISGTP